MSMLNFYINRAGKNLPKSRKRTLERAESLGTGGGDRSSRIARIMDGEFSLDAVGTGRDAA